MECIWTSFAADQLTTFRAYTAPVDVEWLEFTLVFGSLCQFLFGLVARADDLSSTDDLCAGRYTANFCMK